MDFHVFKLCCLYVLFSEGCLAEVKWMKMFFTLLCYIPINSKVFDHACFIIQEQIQLSETKQREILLIQNKLLGLMHFGIIHMYKIHMKSSVSKFCVLVLKKIKASAKDWVSFVLLESPNNHTVFSESKIPNSQVFPPGKCCQYTFHSKSVFWQFSLFNICLVSKIFTSSVVVNGGGKRGEYHGKFYEVIT